MAKSDNKNHQKSQKIKDKEEGSNVEKLPAFNPDKFFKYDRFDRNK